MSWLLLCRLDISQNHLGRRNLNWGSNSTRLACGKTCSAFSWLIIYVGEPSSLWAIPSQLVVLGAISKQTKYSIRSRLEDITPAWPLHQLLSQGLLLVWVMYCAMELKTEINPFLPNLLLIMVFYHSNRNSKSLLIVMVMISSHCYVSQSNIPFL